MEECIARLNLNDKQLILIGTIHMSKRSVEQVKAIIETECPDTVCVELDHLRYLALIEMDCKESAFFADDDFDLQADIACKSSFLLLNTLIAIMQKRIARNLNLLPGQELIQAINSARASGARLVLADCNIQIIFRQIWASLSSMEKSKLLAQTLNLLLAKTTLSETEIETMKSPDNLMMFLNKFTEEFPELKRMLIDERDYVLAQNIKTAPGKKVVGVVGAAHLPGIVKCLLED